MPKVLVIGGAGYIGSHVVKELLANSFDVTVLDNMSTGCKENLFNEAEFIQADILDENALDRVLKQNIDAVIHLAAKKAVGESMENPQKYSTNNLIGTINILNAMLNNNVKHIVFSSSAAVYDGKWHGGHCYLLTVPYLKATYIESSISNSSFFKNKGVEDWSLLGTLPELEGLYWFHNQKITKFWDMSRNCSR